MKKYLKYKESGILWLGEIPENWESKRLKYIVSIFGRIGFRGYTVSDIVEEGKGAISLAPSNIIHQKLNLENRTYISWEKYFESPEIIVEETDVLMVKTASLGKVVYVNKLSENSTINPQLIVFKNYKLNRKFFYYFLISEYFQQQIKKDTFGGVVNTITQENINNYSIVFPPNNIQEFIVNFLDKKTSEIDNLISNKEKLIKLLKEERTVTINNAVTKGINPKAKIKDSGIKWLGEIPEHWKAKKLKYLLEQNFYELDEIDTDFKITLENIESGTGNLVNNSEIKFEGLGNFFKSGDILFNKLRPYLEKVLLAENSGVCVTDLLVFSPNNEISSKFLFYRTLSKNFMNEVNSSSYGVKMPRASWDFISQMIIPYPSIAEQNEIVEYIEKRKDKINITISKIEKEIGLIQEYRTALISEAVTGKIDLRNE